MLPIRQKRRLVIRPQITGELNGFFLWNTSFIYIHINDPDITQRIPPFGYKNQFLPIGRPGRVAVLGPVGRYLDGTSPGQLLYPYIQIARSLRGKRQPVSVGRDRW